MTPPRPLPGPGIRLGPSLVVGVDVRSLPRRPLFEFVSGSHSVPLLPCWRHGRILRPTRHPQPRQVRQTSRVHLPRPPRRLRGWSRGSGLVSCFLGFQALFGEKGRDPVPSPDVTDSGFKGRPLVARTRVHVPFLLGLFGDFSTPRVAQRLSDCKGGVETFRLQGWRRDFRPHGWCTARVK